MLLQFFRDLFCFNQQLTRPVLCTYYSHEGNERDRNLLLPPLCIIIKLCILYGFIIFYHSFYNIMFFLTKEYIIIFYCSGGKLEGPLTFLKPEEGCGNNRSVMPLDVPGCTRATMIIAVSILPSSCAQL